MREGAYEYAWVSSCFVNSLVNLMAHVIAFFEL